MLSELNIDYLILFVYLLPQAQWLKIRITHRRTKTTRTIRMVSRSLRGRDMPRSLESTRSSSETEEEPSAMTPTSSITALWKNNSKPTRHASDPI